MALPMLGKDTVALAVQLSAGKKQDMNYRLCIEPLTDRNPYDLRFLLSWYEQIKRYSPVFFLINGIDLHHNLIRYTSKLATVSC